METELLLHCLERGGIVGVDWVDYAQALKGALGTDRDLLGKSRSVYLKLRVA